MHSLVSEVKGGVKVCTDDERVGAVRGLSGLAVEGDALAVKKEPPEEDTMLCLWS